MKETLEAIADVVNFDDALQAGAGLVYVVFRNRLFYSLPPPDINCQVQSGRRRQQAQLSACVAGHSTSVWAAEG